MDQPRLLEVLTSFSRRDPIEPTGPDSSLSRLRLLQVETADQLSGLGTHCHHPRRTDHAGSADRDPLAHFLVPAASAELQVVDYASPREAGAVGLQAFGKRRVRAPGWRQSVTAWGARTGKTQLSRLLAQQVGAAASKCR